MSGKREKKGITLYHHDKRRSGLVAQEVLGDYSGYVHCDMNGGYRQLETAKLVGCWSHVRRKFFETTPNQVDKTSLGCKGLDYCDKMFALEAEWNALSPKDRLVKRKETLAPLMAIFFDRCRYQAVFPGSKLGRALDCSLKHDKTFKTVLEFGGFK